MKKIRKFLTFTKKHLNLISLALVIVWMLFVWRALAKEARVVKLSEKQTAKIYLKLGRATVLNFPVKPTKVILGNKGSFSIEYVEQDLAIAPLLPQAHGNLFVYLQGKRCGFDLMTDSSKYDDIILIRDPQDDIMKVEPK